MTGEKLLTVFGYGVVNSLVEEVSNLKTVMGVQRPKQYG
jgi:hypothetical protein